MRRLRPNTPLALLFAVLLSAPGAGQEKTPLSLQDMMAFREIHGAAISEDGAWIAYEARPDRGDGEVCVQAVGGGLRIVVERGSGPRFDRTSRWLGCLVQPAFAEREKKPGKKKAEPPRPGFALVELATGRVEVFEQVRSFAFSDDGGWLALHHHEPKKGKEKERPDGEEEGAEEGEGGSARGSEESARPERKRKPRPGAVTLRHLGTKSERRIEGVVTYAFEPRTASSLALAVSETAGGRDGILVLALAAGGEMGERYLLRGDGLRCETMAWSDVEGRMRQTLALVASDETAGDPLQGKLWIWSGAGSTARLADTEAAAGRDRVLPGVNRLTWSDDGARLFFGYRPRALHEILLRNEREAEAKKKPREAPDPYDTAALLEDAEVDVWHTGDPFINPNQKKRWKDEVERTWRAVLHWPSGEVVPLADADVPDVAAADDPRWTVGRSDVPYRREVTWDGRYRDLYRVDLKTGERRRVAARQRGPATMSPEGRYLAWYQDGDWHVEDGETGEIVDLTEHLGVPFANEDHDYPSAPPGYGHAGWVEGDDTLIVYDKYDVWAFDMTPSGAPPATSIGGAPAGPLARCLTGGHGRKSKTTFRLVRLDPERKAWRKGERPPMTGYDEQDKSWGLYRLPARGEAPTELLGGPHRYRLIARSRLHEDSSGDELILYTRESYREFPDLRVATPDFGNPRRLTDVNPQIARRLWGHAELVSWRSLDGQPLQGALIRPEGVPEGTRVPVLVYFYRFFSQRLHEFDPVKINHRPCFPFYAGHGYAVFLPDIRFEVGRPGFAATKCLVPGVQKLIDMGVADPDAIGLHGHSWSGYQTAFIITQTDIFAAAVAGAPVSNMTSAYGGIRWRTGLSRQFQYEKTQSRLGASLWESPARYLENSPLFYADRIHTPLLLMFGDEDGAVPWTQGIELYMALRRLDKPAVFLQYRGEPHHLKKYPNKLDYTRRMKEYFDHHLKGAPAPRWITAGVPYEGR